MINFSSYSVNRLISHVFYGVTTLLLAAFVIIATSAAAAFIGLFVLSVALGGVLARRIRKPVGQKVPVSGWRSMKPFQD